MVDPTPLRLAQQEDPAPDPAVVAALERTLELAYKGRITSLALAYHAFGIDGAEETFAVSISAGARYMSELGLVTYLQRQVMDRLLDEGTPIVGA